MSNPHEQSHEPETSHNEHHNSDHHHEHDKPHEHTHTSELSKKSIQIHEDHEHNSGHHHHEEGHSSGVSQEGLHNHHEHRKSRAASVHHSHHRKATVHHHHEEGHSSGVSQEGLHNHREHRKSRAASVRKSRHFVNEHRSDADEHEHHSHHHRASEHHGHRKSHHGGSRKSLHHHHHGSVHQSHHDDTGFSFGFSLEKDEDFPKSRTVRLSEAQEHDDDLRKIAKDPKLMEKKLSKMMLQFCEELNVKKIPQPTPWVLAWGAGIELGIPKLTLYEFLDPAPAEMRFYEDKTFATIRFDTKEDAEVAVDNLNGTQVVHGQTVYFGYIDGEPPKEDDSMIKALEHEWPEGLLIIPDFVDAREEEEIVHAFIPELAMAAQSHDENMTKNRTSIHFGYEFRYESNNYDVDMEHPLFEDIPDSTIPLITRMMVNNLIKRTPEQLTVTQFTPGQGVPPHVDAHSCFQEPILTLSLGSHTIMDFRHPDGTMVSVSLPRRSLLVMNGDSRLLWTHGIAARGFDPLRDPNNFGLTCEPRLTRISMTFRFLNRSRTCHCKYPEMCDYQRKKLKIGVEPESDANVEEERNFVLRIYDEIASRFGHRRHTPWPKIVEFLRGIDPGQTILDVGCGPGKNFNLNKYIYQVGHDMSNPILKLSETRTAAIHGENRFELPFEDSSFDALIAIAVLHHLSTRERRIEALQEISRVLTDGGKALIYVWAKEQKLQNIKINYARQQALKAGRDPDHPHCDPKTGLKPLRDYTFLPASHHEKNFRFGEMLQTSWISSGQSGIRMNDSTISPHQHIFKEGELENLLREIYPPQTRITDKYYDSGNWVVEFVKESAAGIIQSYEEPKPEAYDEILGYYGYELVGDSSVSATASATTVVSKLNQMNGSQEIMNE